MNRASLGLLVVLVLASGCSSELDDAPVVTVSDSAGIRMVDNAVPGGVAPVYGVLGEPDLQIGVVDGDPALSFTNVVDVRTLPGGDILVVEGRAQELRVFDSAGRHLRSIGGQGQGPGEFGRLGKLVGLSGDTILAWDDRAQRMTWLRAGGEVVSDMLLAPDRDHRVSEVRHMGDGRYLAALMDLSASRNAESRYVAPEPLRFLDADGNVLDSLRHGGGLDMLLFSETNANGMMRVLIGPPPFGRGTSYAVGRQHLFTGWNGEYRIVVWSRTGQPSMIISASDLMRPVDPADADAFRQRRLDDCENEQCERAARAMLDDVVLPEIEPAFSALMVDALEHLWVAEYELEADSVSGWHVFSPDGELLGRVAIPSRLAIHEIGADYVLGAQRDALDVPFVKRFPLSRLE